MARQSRRDRDPKRRSKDVGSRKHEQDPVFAGIVARFADAIARFRNPHEVTWTEERQLWDGQDDGGLAASGVPRRPPDRSGSGSAAMAEPTIDEPSEDFYSRPSM